jgi:hypothetical protein
MIISHRRRFIFFHDPQAAGMSLRAVLAPYHDDPIPPDGIVQAPPFDYQIDFAHLRLQEISLLFPAIIEAAQSYRSLVVVRDPYRRFISAIYRHFKTSYPQLPLLTMRPEEQVLIVETFVEKIFLAQKVLTDYRFVHLSPQVCFLRSDGVTLLTNIVAIDDCGSFIADCLERLGRPLPAQTHHNRSRLDLTHLFKSAKILAFVRDFYTPTLQEPEKIPCESVLPRF